MATTYTFSIATPCAASWQEMTPAADGRFCSSCEKLVVDFTAMTDREIIAYFEKHGKCCGSFKPSQLDREMSVKPVNRWMPAALIAGMLAMVWPEAGKAQDYKITGVVKDSTAHDGLPGVSILVLDKDGKPTNKGTNSQATGEFSLTIPKEYEQGLRLKIMFIGYYAKEVTLSAEDLKAARPLLCEIKADDRTLGEYNIVINTRRSWWKRLKHKLFN